MYIQRFIDITFAGIQFISENKNTFRNKRLDVLVTDEKYNAFHKHSTKRNRIFYIVTH